MGQSILTTNQQLLLDSIITSPEITNSFYLTGGTALAEFYFQHRLSEDLDFFSSQELDEKVIVTWAGKTATQLKVKEVEYKTLRGQLIFFFHFDEEVIKVDFAYYPFPHLGEFKKLKTLQIANPLDIATNKLQAIQTRKRGRDFFDLYFLLTKEKLQISELLQSYKNKFDLTLTTSELSKYFAGILEAVDQPRFLGDFDWKVIEQFFLEEAKKLSNSFVDNNIQK